VFIVITLSNLKINFLDLVYCTGFYKSNASDLVMFLFSVCVAACTKATESSRNNYVKVDRDRAVSIATRYGLDGPGIESR
jgi:hypothetical protein